jgi:hypothetical protein
LEATHLWTTGEPAFATEARSGVWTTYDDHGQLLDESVHEAGTVYGGTKLVVAALWALRGFNR